MLLTNKLDDVDGCMDEILVIHIIVMVNFMKFNFKVGLWKKYFEKSNLKNYCFVKSADIV